MKRLWVLRKALYKTKLLLLLWSISVELGFLKNLLVISTDNTGLQCNWNYTGLSNLSFNVNVDVTMQKVTHHEFWPRWSSVLDHLSSNGSCDGFV